jgi:hypothetical protein
LRSRCHEHRRACPGLLVVLVRWLDHPAVRLVLDRALQLDLGLGFGDARLVRGQELQLLVQRFAERAGFGRLVQLERLGHAAEQQRQRGQRLQQRPVVVFQQLADCARRVRLCGLDRKEAVELT